MFREFKVGELFDINDTIKFNPRDNHLPTGDVPYITRTSKNNGQLDSYSDDSGQFTNKGNCITVGIEGTVAFYQPDDFIAGINVYTLRHERMTQRVGLYLCSVLNMQSWKYGFVNGRTLGRIKAETIQLPVKPGTDEVNYTEDDIDWCYMESYIHELEESYIHELEESYIHELDAYLKETGLDDYTLTDDEREVLEREPVFKEFEVGELLDGVSGDTDIKKVHLDGDGYPVITAGVDNLGVAGYSSVTAKILPANTLTVDMFGNCYFRPFEYKMVTHARVFSLCLKDGQLTPETGLFVCTMLKWLSTKYNYSNMCSYNKIKNETIQLPVKSGTDDDIDWDYMASCVRTMEKQVIADVVDYKNEMISTTKALVKK